MFHISLNALLILEKLCPVGRDRYLRKQVGERCAGPSLQTSNIRNYLYIFSTYLKLKRES